MCTRALAGVYVEWGKRRRQTGVRGSKVFTMSHSSLTHTGSSDTRYSPHPQPQSTICTPQTFPRTHTEPHCVSGISVTIATHTHTKFNTITGCLRTSLQVLYKSVCCSSRNSMKVCVQGKDGETQRGTERGRF